MDFATILVKCITLLFRESQLPDLPDNSADTVKTTLEKIPSEALDMGVSTVRNTVASLKQLAMEMCNKPIGYQYETNELLQQVRLACCGDEITYKAVAQGIESEMQPPIIKRTITNLKKSISEFYRDQVAAERLRKASRDFNFNRNSIADKTAYLHSLISELEILVSRTNVKDQGLIKSMDFADPESTAKIYDEAQSSAGEGLAFRTGYQELDEALQGGPRPGDCVVTAALQHNYKTGFTLSLFSNIAIFNKPRNTDPNKKPLMYRVSCEDPLRNNAQFMYQLIRYQETGEEVDITKVSTKDARDYVTKKMTQNGYHIKMDEVNPQLWNYQAIINRIIELQSQGYVIEVFCIDYLSKIPTTGCTQGSIGDDMMNLLERIKAYCSSQSVLFVSPHQLSTEAKKLLQIVPPTQFLETIKGGGYFEKTKGLDRIYDIGILLHKVETPNADWLHVLIDKHRFPSVIETRKKSFFLQFPKNKMPIPSNYGIEGYKVHRKIPSGTFMSDENVFL